MWTFEIQPKMAIILSLNTSFCTRFNCFKVDVLSDCRW